MRPVGSASKLWQANSAAFDAVIDFLYIGFGFFLAWPTLGDLCLGQAPLSS